MSNLVTDDSSLVDRYVKQIRQHRVLSADEERVLAKHFQQTGDCAAARDLVLGNLGLVVKIAHQYRGYGVSLLDLIQEGNLGLLRAVEKFDPARGFRSTTYAGWWIRAFMRKAAMSSWSLVRIGSTNAERKLFFGIRSRRNAAEQRHARHHHAATRELVNALGLPEETILAVEHRMAFRDSSLDARLRPESEHTQLGVLVSNGPGPEDLVVLSRLRQAVRAAIGAALPQLNEREQYVIEHRLLAEHPQSLREIGDRFGVSRERVRQIQTNILEKLRSNSAMRELAA